MSFAWLDYLVLAEALLQASTTLAPEEACCRAAISRAYYAVDGAARLRARDQEGVRLPAIAQTTTTGSTAHGLWHSLLCGVPGRSWDSSRPWHPLRLRLMTSVGRRGRPRPQRRAARWTADAGAGSATYSAGQREASQRSTRDDLAEAQARPGPASEMATAARACVPLHGGRAAPRRGRARPMGGRPGGRRWQRGSLNF